MVMYDMYLKPEAQSNEFLKILPWPGQVNITEVEVEFRFWILSNYITGTKLLTHSTSYAKLA